ncbi:Probable low-affinity inorganic phosphate transporter [hydrothermal vent metagenome]|uniref:Probable low-affinity inorganic phosphate transporter n=1 Tax=hydrothermal vent metagenome TaxID=652676 RepID=A0A1W1EAS6_9ZZZZ
MEQEKLRKLKAELDACTNEDPVKKLVLVEAHKAQKKEVKRLKKMLKEEYVKRDMVKKIVAAWVITVPAAAMLAALIFYVIKGLGL